VSLSILHVSQPVDGGVARCIADLVADQIARGWRVTVACPDGGPLPPEVSSRGANHEVWPARRNPGPRSAAELVRLRGIIGGRSPDVVHLHSSKAGLAGRLLIRGRRPTLFQPHAWSFFAVDGPMRTAALKWERRAAAWADAIVCVSEAERAAGEEAGIRAAWQVVPNGIDLDAFAPATPGERAEARKRLGLGSAPLAVCVGRFSRQKGQDVIAEAWPKVVAAVPDAELVLVGSGPDEAALRQRARVVDDQGGVRAWLAAANVVVQPSRWEGLAYTVLEAMASARNVVATDVGGMREALGDDGVLVPTEDVKSLASVIAGQLLDPEACDARGRALRERVERLYDVRRATNEMAELYGDVLERRSSQ
jgi:glycosyltransferase involved in cell wall biosynthesis